VDVSYDPATLNGVTRLPGSDGPYLAAALIALRAMARARREDFWPFLDRVPISCDVRTADGTYGVGTLNNSYHEIGRTMWGASVFTTQAEAVCAQLGISSDSDLAVCWFCDLSANGKDDAWPFLSNEQSVWKIARHIRSNLPDRPPEEDAWMTRTLLQALAIPYLYLERGWQGVPSLPASGLAAAEIARLRWWRALLPSSNPARRRARLIPRRGQIDVWKLTLASIFAQAQEIEIPAADLVRISRRLRDIWKASKQGYDDLNRKARNAIREQGIRTESLPGGFQLGVVEMDHTNAFVLPQMRRARSGGKGFDVVICSERGGRRIIIQARRERVRFTGGLDEVLAAGLGVPRAQVITDRHSGTIGIGGFPSRPVSRILDAPYDLETVVRIFQGGKAVEGNPAAA
jgi:hypothetical protein